MASNNINRVTLTGNLTRDPELRMAGSTPVCGLRLAVNGRRRTAEGQWVDVPNYFDVSVFGGQGENVARYLSKGSPVAVDGRLQWREWTDKDGNKRQTVDIVADTVQFLSSGSGNSQAATPAEADIPVDTSEFVGAGVSGAEDDIPF